MALTFTTTRQAAHVSGIKALVYGNAGTGKTSLCGTAPRPLIISAESGLLPLRGLDIPVIPISNVTELGEALVWCRSNPHARAVETVCLDSATEIAEVVLSAEKKKTRDPRAAYGALIEEMIGIIKAFRDLPGKNVVVTAKEAATTNTVTGVSSFGPSMPGKTVGPDLPYYFDEVFNANIGRDHEGKRFHFLRTQGDMQYVAKDRSGVLREIEVPDLTYIFNRIRETTSGSA